MPVTEIPEWLVMIVVFGIGVLARRPIARLARRAGRAVASAWRHAMRMLRFATVPAGGTLTERHPDGSTWTVDRSSPPEGERKRGRGRQRG